MAFPLPKNEYMPLKGLVHTIKGLTLMKKEVMPRVLPSPKGLLNGAGASCFPDKQAAPVLTQGEFCHRDCEYPENPMSCCPQYRSHGTSFRWHNGPPVLIAGPVLRFTEAGQTESPVTAKRSIRESATWWGSMARWPRMRYRDVLKAYCSFIGKPPGHPAKLIFEDDKVYIRFEEPLDVRDAIEMAGQSFPVILEV